jgi:hypothetical protein
MLQKCKECITVPTYPRDDKTDCCNYQGISLLSTICTYKSYQMFNLSRLTPQIELLRMVYVDFDITDQLSDSGEKVGVHYMLRESLSLTLLLHLRFREVGGAL